MDDVEVRAVYQPVVHLESGAVLGYEALARGPEGTSLESPVALLAAAREVGRGAELDWRCRAAAIQGALDADLGSSLTLFVNVEPDTDPGEPPPELHSLLAEAQRRLRIVCELTESAVIESPASLLASVEWARERSWGVALDDIGADSASLSVMPFLVPDVVKLDLSLIHRRGRSEVGEIVSAVLTQAERTGAAIVAEGIETEEHREAALAMGATLGQGWLFGRPGPLPPERPEPPQAITLLRPPAGPAEVTPFAVVRGARPLRRGAKPLLVGIAAHLEEQALTWREAPVVLSSFEAGERVPPPAVDRYGQLAASGALVAVLGPDVELEPHPGVRVARFPHDSPLAEEWSVVLVGAHYCGALVARRVNDDGCYDFAVTHDRDLVVEAGRALLRQIGRDVW